MPFTNIRLSIPRNLAMSLNIGDRVKATVLGEVVEVEAMQPIGEGPEAVDLPRDIPGGSVVVDVSMTRIRKRAADEMQEEFAKMGLDEDEDDD